ncbi:MAG TPA: sulfotransferase domain-containing protein [Anaerolineae bacterium]|nr:sulfotransferase domain-containing protein [Anaerolineae bacterium]HXW00903.1 sulfotransferase domain-containing protein [Anaerolineae bacterium]
MLKVFGQLFGPKEQVKSITIVSGLPRSGTSMMMKILEAGGLPPLTDNFRRADADNPQGYYEFERVKQLPKGDIAWLGEAQGKAVKVIAILLPHLPATYTYRFIFMRRAMPEILASQRQMLIRRGEDPDKMSDEELSRLYEKHIQQVNTWVSNQPHVQRIDVDYNQLLQNSRPEIKRVNQFLGNTLNLEKMIEVIDPTLYRQRQTD